MGRERFSVQALKVLKVFLEAFQQHNRELYGIEIIRLAGLSSGTVYPLLLRFEEEGLLTSRWEIERPQDLQRPRRRLYQITGDGARVAREALSALIPASAAPSFRLPPTVSEA